MVTRIVDSFITEGKSPFFLSELWCASLGSELKKLSVFKSEKDKEPIANLTFYAYRRMGVDAVITPPMAPHCGLHFYHRTEKKLSRYSDEKRALRSIAEYLAEKYPSAHVDLALPPEIKDIQPFKQAEFKSDVSYTYLLEIERRTEQDLLSEMSSERRKNIRDAEKKGYDVRINSEPEAIVTLVQDTLESKGVKSKTEQLTHLIKEGKGKVFTVSVFRQDELQSAAVIALDKSKAYYLAGGTKKETAEAGALVLWRAILEARKHSVQHFDFLGSSNPAIEKFFRGFGGQLTPYFRIIADNVVFDFLRSAKRTLGK
ncbi:GNAT family N-acetyltransferase [Cryomorphaceae bacterium 1068]|nr:GNAT family N-acetyltransferase [Cryomorphaceae bacterium 1068]